MLLNSDSSFYWPDLIFQFRHMQSVDGSFECEVDSLGVHEEDECGVSKHSTKGGFEPGWSSRVLWRHMTLTTPTDT
jgi:hypothetical protein